MKGKYTRLKLKMLLSVVVGTLIAGAVGIFLLEVVIDGVLQDPFARFFLWGAQTLFGQSAQEAAQLYQTLIRDNKQEILTICIMVLMLIAFYLALGRFTHWLEDIRSATRRVVEERGADPVVLPRELSPIQADLNAIQLQLAARERSSREAEQRKGDLVAFLAHDLKTPLTSVVGYLTLLHDDPGLDEAQRAKFTGIALDKAQRLETLINEFFEITRFNLTQLSLDLEDVNLTRLLEQVTFEFQPTLAEKHLKLELNLEPEVVLSCDPDKLERVFDNLLRNAMNYSNPNTAITVTLARTEETAVITMDNHSQFIPQEKLDRIFEQFFRLDSSRSSSSGGAGLGLAIAKEIVELHSGTIRAESAGDRITFVVTLPLARSQEP